MTTSQELFLFRKRKQIKQRIEIKSQQILIAHCPLSQSVMNHFLSAVRRGHGVDGGASFQKKPGDMVSCCTSWREPRKSKDTGISLASGYFHFLLYRIEAILEVKHKTR